MDKLMDQRWFMKIIALLLALLLYSAVSDINKKSSDNSVPSDRNTETIEGVQVTSYYDTENLVISGIPNTVDVTIKGPMPQVQSAKALKNFEVYVDLEDITIGDHTVPIKIKNISGKLEARIDPTFANISVQERVTKVFDVEAEYNTGLLEDGYVAEKPVVEPSKVQITGAKGTIDRITYVKATLDMKDEFNDTITRDAKIRVLDRELNKLDVVIEPETVQVTIPVKSTKKKVPIKILKKGSLPDGILLEDMTLDTDEATIIGTEDVLKKTESVRVEVNLDTIDGDTTITLPVIISEGITKVTPETVKVKVKVTKMEERTFSNLIIRDEGLSDSYELEFQDPIGALADLTVFGPSDEINNLSPNDFKLFIDVSSLRVGNHEVDIRVEGPADVNWKLDKRVAHISITQKEV